jgi:hypothetical protein
MKVAKVMTAGRRGYDGVAFLKSTGQFHRCQLPLHAPTCSAWMRHRPPMDAAMSPDKALERYFDEHYEALYRFLRYSGATELVTEDLSQEAFPAVTSPST